MRVTAISLRRNPDTGLCTVAVRTEECPRWVVVIEDSGDLIDHTSSLGFQLTWWERFRVWAFGRL